MQETTQHKQQNRQNRKKYDIKYELTKRKRTLQYKKWDSKRNNKKKWRQKNKQINKIQYTIYNKTKVHIPAKNIRNTMEAIKMENPKGLNQVETELYKILKNNNPTKIKGVAEKLRSAKLLINIESERSRLYRFKRTYNIK